MVCLELLPVLSALPGKMMTNLQESVMIPFWAAEKILTLLEALLPTIASHLSISFTNSTPNIPILNVTSVKNFVSICYIHTTYTSPYLNINIELNFLKAQNSSQKLQMEASRKTCSKMIAPYSAFLIILCTQFYICVKKPEIERKR